MRGLALLILVLVAIGCSHCPEVRSLKVALTERKATSTPHMIVAVPLALASTFANEELSRLKPLSLAPPAVSAIAALAGNFDVRASDGAFIPLGDDRLGLRTKLTLRLEDEDLFAFTIVMRLRPTFEARSVVLRVHGDDMRALRPELGPATKKALGRALAETALGKLLDEESLSAVSGALVTFLGGTGFELIRDHLLSDVGEVTTLRLDYPPIPLQKARLRVQERDVPAIVLEVQTSLPVRVGLRGRTPVSPSRVGIALTGSALAEVGNWAMAEGHVPARFDTDMKPDPNGTVEPRLDWSEGDERPLTIHAFTEDPFCARVKVQAKLGAKIVDERVVIDVSDGAITAVDGNWITKLGVWLSTVGAGPIAFSTKQVARFGMTLGSRERSVSLADIRVVIRSGAPDTALMALDVR